MKPILRRLAVAGAALPLALFGLAGVADAQQGGFGGPPPNRTGPAMAAQAPENRAAELRHTLQLRPDQEGALQDFVRDMTPSAELMQAMRRQREEERTMTTPQRLDAMLANMDRMRDVVVSRVRATKRFYGTLTPAQQRAFDAMEANGGMGGPR